MTATIYPGGGHNNAEENQDDASTDPKNRRGQSLIYLLKSQMPIIKFFLKRDLLYEFYL